MSTDNRTVINDCESTTGWAGDDAVTLISDTGQHYEGSNSLSTQLTNADEHMYTTQDSVGASTFSLDWSDSTLYLLVKDNLGNSAANGGVQFVIGDGTNRVGYDVGGNDAPGCLLSTYFQSYKLDVSVIVTTPGSFATYAGSEASLSQSACTQIGYGSLHLAKASGAVDNVFMDCFRYIANGSYALTINGGTSGTPETMADVQGDDVTNGWGMIGNPLGDQYLFFAPTEWGNASATANHYFEASNEQWYWLGDNGGGGHSVGAGNFPFRVIGNATDTGLFRITNVVIVNTGTGSDFDCSNSNVNTLEIDACSFSGLASFKAPASGGTSRFCTNTLFASCGTVTHGGADMSGCQILTSAVSADTGALVYNITADPDGEMDDMVFSKGTNAHHAVEFGTSAPNSGTSPTSMTLRGCTFTGFNASDAQNDSTFLFPDTGSDVTWTLNLVGCSGNFSYKKARSGDTVNIVVDPVTALVNVNDNTGADLQNARVIMEAGDGTGDLPYLDSVTITRSGTTASVSHTAHGLSAGAKVTIRGANETEYNGVFVISNVTTNAYDYTVSGTPASPATGTITSTGVVLEGLTDVNGQISGSRSYTVDQNVRYKIRKASSSPYFKPIPASGWLTDVIDNVTGLTVSQQMILDE